MPGRESGQVRGSGQLIKELNRSRILECLQHGEPLSRVELAERTGISLPAVSKLVREMQAEGLVASVGEGPSSGGQRQGRERASGRQRREHKSDPARNRAEAVEPWAGAVLPGAQICRLFFNQIKEVLALGWITGGDSSTGFATGERNGRL